MRKIKFARSAHDFVVTFSLSLSLFNYSLLFLKGKDNHRSLKDIILQLDPVSVFFFCGLKG